MTPNEFETAIRNLEELAKTGVIGGATININNDALLESSHVGKYYKLISSENDGSYMSKRYRKTYKYKLSSVEITVSLFRKLTANEVKQYAKYVESKKELDALQETQHQNLKTEHGLS